VRRSVVFNKDLDQTIERVRKSLAMTRSGFIRYSVLRMLERLNVLSEKAHQEARITYETGHS
jgi:hypothetical protein